ncbi:MAG: ABC transporter permease, partial [Oscillospiraceae bacterium]|nr:ABC transporter permease [Oscillospiraceae bacterium]
FEAYIMVPSEAENFRNFIDMHTRQGKSPIELGDGVVLGEKLAKFLGVKVGDEVYFAENKPIRVDGICENYTFNYAYMKPETYAKTGLGELKNNILLMNMTDENASDELSEILLEHEAVLGISYSSGGGDKFRDLVDSLALIVVAIIASAGALAFVVLFNLSNINVNERIRELATIKVLGFFDGEVAAYIYRENILSTIMGTGAGLIMGIFLEKFVVQTAEVDAVMFAPGIAVYCFFAAAAISVFFSVLVNITLYFRLKKIDMATSLKAIE